MATQSQLDPIISIPFLYKVGLVVSNDATTPNTVLDIAAGQCRDSNDIMDICIGVNNPNLQGVTVSAPILLNAAVNGANGLDAGTFAASTMYAVYAIADSRYFQPAGCLLSLASNAAPSMPFGYDSYRKIGYWATNSSTHFILGYNSGNYQDMTFFYDAPQATAITAGAATSYTAVNLTTLVPPVNNLKVNIQSLYTPAAAGSVLSLQGVNSTGAPVVVHGQVAAVVVATNSELIAQLSTVSPEINYKVSSGSDAVALNVVGFNYSV